MFEVDREHKRLSKLDTKTFGELKIRERKDLQEWLANCPSALGEELLIIQKEFAGFDETRERLDLLALDKNGSLVIIENKLDDSGRDVVWQALKYVAYCSTLKKSDIEGIFQDYLKKRRDTSDDAGEIMCRFLEVGSIDEAEINVGTSQRIILVAANFRKEVTSTVIWLLANGISVQCMKVTPYGFDEKLLLDVSQIIPTPETKDYMIGMSSKQSEEKATKVTAAKTAQLNLCFWGKLLEHFGRDGFKLFQNISPSTKSFISASAGGGLAYFLIFVKKEVRVDFYIMRPDTEDNKKIFDLLLKKKSAIETRFDASLEWSRLEDGKYSKIGITKTVDSHNKDNWEEIIDWFLENTKNMKSALKPEIKDIRK